ncbi:MAG: CRISPR-associated helicase Cas3' [Deltaproteobacteria bacterium]|nr:CRISPR-associated helicase Cas3' [Deltaproteobacteria bacterium]
MRGQPTYFWGKMARDGDNNVVEWHPLIDHCADVAAVCEALLTATLLRKRLARLGGLEDLDDVQVARLCVLAALHDIGKFNNGFQNKALTKPGFAAGHVSEVLALFSAAGYRETKSLNTALRFSELQGWAVDPETVCQLLVAAISHHGRPAAVGGHGQQAWWSTDQGRDPFAGIADLVEQSQVWFPKAWLKNSAPLPASFEFHHAFSGLVMLADWLGSDTRCFPFRQDHEKGDDRMNFARRQAARALTEIGIDASGPRSALKDRPITLGLISSYHPRPVQHAVQSLEIDRAPSIAVLEAETGSGKTEAALLYFVRLLKSGVVDGMYFALPTRTAATQIRGRVVEAIRRAFAHETSRPPVVLAVPGYLCVDDVEGQALPNFEVLWTDKESERLRYRGWAAEQPKRYLTGAVVVGTVDQVLLSALQVGHSHLRATALLKQLLVVDEVHASDCYMNTILEEVLGRHVRAGGHALLMSATLGAAARERLLKPGQRAAFSPLQQALSTPYPLITHSDGKHVEIEGGSTTAKSIAVELQPLMDHAAAVAEQALDAARCGARVLVVRNTVSDCRATQEALEQLARDAGCPDVLFRCAGVEAPHHARFAAADRRLLDAAIEASFGLHRQVGGCVAVATQTVQQSLDLDADLLLTDLCPMDVLLQRIGRLHRHQRLRPASFERARVVVLTPEQRDLSGVIDTKGRARGQHGLGTVYDDLRIVEATWRTLLAHAQIEIPGDNRLLVENSLNPEILDRLVGALDERWRLHAMRCQGSELADRRTASLGLSRWDVPFGDQRCLFSHDDKRIGTRLGEGDRIARFACPFKSAFGKDVSELHIPAWWARGVADDATAVVVESADQRVRFTFGSRVLVYDRLGLRPLPVDDNSRNNVEEDEADG